MTEWMNGRVCSVEFNMGPSVRISFNFLPSVFHVKFDSSANTVEGGIERARRRLATINKQKRWDDSVLHFLDFWAASTSFYVLWGGLGGVCRYAYVCAYLFRSIELKWKKRIQSWLHHHVVELNFMERPFDGRFFFLTQSLHIISRWNIKKHSTYPILHARCSLTTCCKRVKNPLNK